MSDRQNNSTSQDIASDDEIIPKGEDKFSPTTSDDTKDIFSPPTCDELIPINQSKVTGNSSIFQSQQQHMPQHQMSQQTTSRQQMSQEEQQISQEQTSQQQNPQQQMPQQCMLQVRPQHMLQVMPHQNILQQTSGSQMPQQHMPQVMPQPHMLQMIPQCMPQQMPQHMQQQMPQHMQQQMPQYMLQQIPHQHILHQMPQQHMPQQHIPQQHMPQATQQVPYSVPGAQQQEETPTATVSQQTSRIPPRPQHQYRPAFPLPLTPYNNGILQHPNYGQLLPAVFQNPCLNCPHTLMPNANQVSPIGDNRHNECLRIKDNELFWKPQVVLIPSVKQHDGKSSEILLQRDTQINFNLTDKSSSVDAGTQTVEASSSTSNKVCMTEDATVPDMHVLNGCCPRRNASPHVFLQKTPINNKTCIQSQKCGRKRKTPESAESPHVRRSTRINNICNVKKRKLGKKGRNCSC